MIMRSIVLALAASLLLVPAAFAASDNDNERNVPGQTKTWLPGGDHGDRGGDRQGPSQRCYYDC